MENFSLRVPEQWAGRVNSVHVQRWLADFLQVPRPLPPDPGAGPLQISLSLPANAVQVLAGRLGEPDAVALRRLSALHLASLPPGGHELILPVAVVPESLPWSAASLEYSESVGAPGCSSLEWYENPPASVQVSRETVGPGGWWAELPFQVRVSLIAGVLFLLVFLFSKYRKRTPIRASLPKPEFNSWTPVGF